MQYVPYYVRWYVPGDQQSGLSVLWPDRYEPGTEPQGHWRDEDCDVGDDGTCRECGVGHGVPQVMPGIGNREIRDFGESGCSCGGYGFHKYGCFEADREDGIYPIPVQYDGDEQAIRAYLEKAYRFQRDPIEIEPYRDGKTYERSDLPEVSI